MVRAPKPAPSIADSPQVALVSIAAGKYEVPAVRGPVSRCLARRRPVRKNGVQATAVGGHLPQRFAAVFAGVNREPDVLSIGRPGRTFRTSIHVNELTKLCPIAMNGIQALAAHKYDLRAVRRPRGIMARRLAQSSRLANLHRPQP